MTKRIQGLDADGNPVEMYVHGDVHISEINLEDNWKVTTEDEDGGIDAVNFIGGRPNDR
jgi:hypothetical protein